MIDKKEVPSSPSKRPSLGWDLITGGLIGAVGLIGVLAGWTKLLAWAKEIKPDYSRIGKADDVIAGILGGVISTAYSRERDQTQNEYTLQLENAHLQGHIDQLTAEKSFTQQVAAENSHKHSHPISRS